MYTASEFDLFVLKKRDIVTLSVCKSSSFLIDILTFSVVQSAN